MLVFNAVVATIDGGVGWFECVDGNGSSGRFDSLGMI